MIRPTTKLVDEIVRALREIARPQEHIIYRLINYPHRSNGFPRRLADTTLVVENAVRSATVEITDDQIIIWNSETANIVEMKSLQGLTRLSVAMIITEMLSRNGYFKTITSKHHE